MKKDRRGRKEIISSVCRTWVSADTVVRALIDAGYPVNSSSHAIYYYAQRGFIKTRGRGKDKLVKLAGMQDVDTISSESCSDLMRIADELDETAAENMATARALRAIAAALSSKAEGA